MELIPTHLDKNHFVSIIGNLVTNALEAVELLPEEKRMIRIFIVDNGEEILIEIEDSGHGLADEVQDVLFQEKVSTKDYEESRIRSYESGGKREKSRRFYHIRKRRFRRRIVYHFYPERRVY